MEFFGGLIFLAVAMAVSIAVASVFLAALSALVAKRGHRAAAVVRGALVAVGSIVWCAIVIAIYATTFDMVERGQLGHGYEVRMYEEDGNVAVQTVKPDHVLAEPEVDSPMLLQVADPYVLAQLPTPSQPFLMLDMRTHQIRRMDSVDDLRAAAAARDIKLALEPPEDVYWRYTRSPVDTLFWLMALVPVGIAVVMHLIWAARRGRSAVGAG